MNVVAHWFAAQRKWLFDRRFTTRITPAATIAHPSSQGKHVIGD
jgi:hypothetical protein